MPGFSCFIHFHSYRRSEQCITPVIITYLVRAVAVDLYLLRQREGHLVVQVAELRAAAYTSIAGARARLNA